MQYRGRSLEKNILLRARRDFSPKLNDLTAQENILFARDRPRDRKAVPLAILPSKEWVRYSLDLLKRLDFVVDLASECVTQWEHSQPKCAFATWPFHRRVQPTRTPRGVFEGAAEHLRRGARPPRRALPRREVPTRRSSPAASPADPGAARTGPRGAGGRKVHVPDGLAAAAAASSAAGGTTNTHHKYTPARLSPLCRGGLFGPTGRATLGAPDVSAGVCSGGLGRPSTSHTVLVVNQDPPSSARCLCRTSSGRLLCRAGQRGWRRGTRGRSVKPLWAPTRFKWRVGPSQTRCVPPPRAPFDPVRSERRPSGVQSLRMVSGRELLLGLWRPPLALFFTVFCLHLA